MLALCVPIADQIHAATFHSILAGVPRPYHLLDRRGVKVEQARNDIVGRLLYDPELADVTHLLWIDDDMVFEPGAVERLLAHDLPIVGGLCHGRRAPHYAPILLHRQPGGMLGYSYQHDYPEGLVKVDATGGAFILVKREVYEAIEKAFPRAGEGPYTDRGFGEDISFCERARECGFDTYVDTTVKIGHVAEVVVDEAFARKNRESEFNPWHPVVKSPEGKPVASIVIPTYNQRPEWLREAVASALAQSVPVEVIVVDDGSDEELSAQRVLHGALGEQFDTVRLVRVPHAGCYSALNAGIRAMTTEWFCWLSSDDVLRPVKVERQLQALLATGAKVGFHAYDTMHEDGRLTNQAIVPYQWRSLAEQQHVLATACAINGLTAMIHRSVFGEVGLFDAENFPITADYEMWNRIAAAGHLWHALPDLLATRRVGDENYSVRYANDPKKKAQWLAEDARIRKKYAPRCGKCGGSLR